MASENDDLIEYDDDEAVEFIINIVPEEFKSTIDKDTVNYVLDVVYEFYEKKGLIEENSAEEASIDEEEMLEYIMKAVKKDKMKIGEEETRLILEGEYEYGKSIGIYTEED
ncbi:MAG: hypothetical protein ACK5L7_07040 [Paludibacteraceae bacterium]